MIAGRGTAVVAGIMALLALTGVAVAASKGGGVRDADPAKPDAEDCEDLHDQLSALTALRSDLQNARASVQAAVNAASQAGYTDEEALVQLAELNTQLGQVGAQITQTQAQLEECQS